LVNSAEYAEMWNDVFREHDKSTLGVMVSCPGIPVVKKSLVWCGEKEPNVINAPTNPKCTNYMKKYQAPGRE